MPPLRILLLSLAAAPLLACGSDQSGGSMLGNVAQWRAEPDLRIGSVNDANDANDALTWIRALEVDDAGNIYSLHPQEQLIRTFDPSGAFRRIIGGRGQGPGEFQNLLTVGWVGDTLWALDVNGYRFSEFSTEGEFLGSFSVPFEMGSAGIDGAGPPRATGLLWDGTVEGAPSTPSHAVATGAVTERIPMLMTRDGKVTDTLPSIPWGNSTWAVFDPDNPRSGGSYGRQPFGDYPLMSFVPGERALLHLSRPAPQGGNRATFRLTKLTFAGDTLYTREYSVGTLPIQQSEIDSILDARARPMGEAGFLGATVATAREWAAATLYTPPFRSPVSAMLVARNGDVWLQKASVGDMATWLVLDPMGTPRGEVRLPASLNVSVADETAVWGWEMDDLDVPYIVRYRIETGE